MLQGSESSAESKQAVFSPLASWKASAVFQGEKVGVEMMGHGWIAFI